jgi:ring-1,2-phenylacetyl-CoA epoxidase subunit PaaC
MPFLAQINIAKLKAPIDSPLLADFAAQLDQVNAMAESSAGFIWRLKDETGSATTLSLGCPWGPEYIVNMSVWQDIDSLKNFAYQQSSHVGVLRRRHEWFDKMTSPHLGMWWLQDDQLPTLLDAKRRLDYLEAQGETEYAFNFKKSFEPEQCIFPNWYQHSLLRLADDALIHGQRIAEWCGHGPILEEDIALANIGLDYIGQARMLLTRAGQVEGKSRGEDELAYLRNQEEFFNSSLVELPNSSRFGERDYAVTVTKLFLHSALMLEVWASLMQSIDATIRAVAQKAIKETTYHFEHASQWMIRFGDGTDESNQRVSNALEVLWPYTHEWFDDDAVDAFAQQNKLVALRADLRQAWLARIDKTITQANLVRPKDTAFLSNGKRGMHSEYLGFVLAEMQSIARQHSGVQW